jgi:hypothetical protein
MADVADVRALDISGGLAALTDGQIQTYLDLAALQIDTDTWGDCYDSAHALLAAHNLTSAMVASGGGPVTSASGGGLSITFGTSTSHGGSWGSTAYGRQLQALALACGIVVLAVHADMRAPRGAVCGRAPVFGLARRRGRVCAALGLGREFVKLVGRDPRIDRQAVDVNNLAGTSRVSNPLCGS